MAALFLLQIDFNGGREIPPSGNTGDTEKARGEKKARCKANDALHEQ